MTTRQAKQKAYRIAADTVLNLLVVDLDAGLDAMDAVDAQQVLSGIEEIGTALDARAVALERPFVRRRA